MQFTIQALTGFSVQNMSERLTKPRPLDFCFVEVGGGGNPSPGLAGIDPSACGLLEGREGRREGRVSFSEIPILT